MKRLFTLLAILLSSVSALYPARYPACSDCVPRVVLKSNLLSDALLTPDLGLEVSLSKYCSLSAEGVWAWWSKRSADKCWKIYGGNLEFRWWFGQVPRRRLLTGHHLGVYTSLHSFDFQLGRKGCQCPGLMSGVGLSYGYSFKLSDRLNLDIFVSGGISRGKLIEYEKKCGAYQCLSNGRRTYFGPTAAGVTLVWFPGKNHANNPMLNL